VSGAPRSSPKLVLAAMIFAVAMTFIDQTIVAIASPEIQRELSLSSTGVQWIVNGYLVALAALFALGGRLADVLGHRRMVVIGVIVFATASALCGATPTGSVAEAWIVTFRVIQGVGAALMYPAALAIVLESYELRERGRALAIFFGIAGGLTSIGPIAGGYLSEWTWRSIFWINVPVAIVALVLTARARPENRPIAEPIDWPGAALVTAGMGLSVLGLQQSSQWGWGDARTLGAIGAGLALLAVFVLRELRVEQPLIRVRIFRSRAFAVENGVLFFSTMVFIPVFFFASLYSQLSLGWSTSDAGLYLLTLFAGFAPAAQVGGRILDQRGAKPTVVLGCALGALGFALWAGALTDRSFDAQWLFIVMAGAGLGLMFGPANTDAVNRAPRTSYGEANGIVQTVRNFGASVGLAVLGTILLTENRGHIERSLEQAGVPAARANAIAHSIQGAGGGTRSALAGQAGPQAKALLATVQDDFARSSQTIFYVMAAVLALSALLAAIGLRAGRQEAIPDAVGEEERAVPRREPAAGATG